MRCYKSFDMKSMDKSKNWYLYSWVSFLLIPLANIKLREDCIYHTSKAKTFSYLRVENLYQNYC